MSPIRLLNTGEWSKPPVLTAARRLLIEGLAEHFPKTPLGGMAAFVNGTSYDTGKLSNDGVPIIRISNITTPESSFLRTAEKFDSRFVACRGDLLVSWSASFKSIIWPKERGIVNQHIFKVTEEPGYHRGFIRHTIEAVFDDLQTNVVGIGMKHLRRRDFLEHAVPNPDPQTQELVSNYLDWLENRNGEPEPPLPPKLSEQRRIVGRLEHLASKIEEARGLQQKVCTEVAALPRAVIFQNSGDADMVPMSDLVRLKEPDVTVQPHESYSFAGVYSFGRGVFRGDTKKGSSFKYPKLTRVSVGVVLLESGTTCKVGIGEAEWRRSDRKRAALRRKRPSS